MQSKKHNGTIGTVVERPTAALRVASSIPRNKYLYGLRVIIPGLAVKFVNATTMVTIQEFTPSVGYCGTKF